MKIVAYCRVATDKADQLNSLEAQKEFFSEYTQRAGDVFKQIEDITDVHEMSNVQLERLIKKIEVDKNGNMDIYLRLLGDLGLNESILVAEACENKIALNSNNQIYSCNKRGVLKEPLFY